MVDNCINTNPRIKWLWYSCILILLGVLTAGIYIFQRDTSMTGAVLLLSGALGLMFIVVLYIYECIFLCETQ